MRNKILTSLICARRTNGKTKFEWGGRAESACNWVCRGCATINRFSFSILAFFFSLLSLLSFCFHLKVFKSPRRFFPLYLFSNTSFYFSLRTCYHKIAKFIHHWTGCVRIRKNFRFDSISRLENHENQLKYVCVALSLSFSVRIQFAKETF